jgi:membrane-associated phospholipid phosphatase
MSRGIGLIEATESLPDVAIVIAGLVTQLGDMWFVLLGILLVYWVGIRDQLLTDTLWRDCLYLFSLAISSYALTVVLKHVFMLPRPPGATTAVAPAWIPATGIPIYKSIVTGDGFGFPSGHALKSTVVYGGAALMFSKWNPRRRYFLAAIIVVLVAISRVVLGVHYLTDVVAGILIGLVFLAGMNRVTKTDPRRAFVITAVLGLFAFVMATGYKSGMTIMASALGLGLWEFSGHEDDYVPTE